ncbi:protein kinase domain-containing protein [Campylobacter devanensis]|uniref:protein kinase domain-containing protein n=1 Tax=Campylobacter devanensis TaxID=3161138 RepID=UPI000A34DF4F|nr:MULTISPECIES: hypothetical protein [unclassified Campylobacter]
MNKCYIDEQNNRHYIKDELGRGGQGVVYRTCNPDTVIKVPLYENEELNEERAKKFSLKIQNLIYKPIDDNINVARPLLLLKDTSGYVMELLNDMVPLKKIDPSSHTKSENKNTEYPNFLSELSKKDKRSADYIYFYLKSGGLRRRLNILKNIAIELLKLHSLGLVYCDISFENIFIDDEDNICFIDADNIEYSSKNQSRVFTPGFEVPEVASDNIAKPNSLYSDIYAFAILAFKLLTMAHPFDGDENESDWDCESSERKEQWELPWICDSNDDSNKSTKGLQGTLTTTAELLKLFHIVFEKGKDNIYERPTIPLWAKEFAKAYSKTILCPNCHMSYYDDLHQQCPYCLCKKPMKIFFESLLNGNPLWYFCREIVDKEKISIPSYVYLGFDCFAKDNFCEVEYKKTKNSITISFDNALKENMYVIDNNVEKKISLNKYKYEPSILIKGIMLKIKRNIFDIDMRIRIEE